MNYFAQILHTFSQLKIFGALKVFNSFLIIVSFFLIYDIAHSSQITVAWNANSEPDLAGYKLHYGTSSGNYSTIVDVGDSLEHTITGLKKGVAYYFAATAYDTEGNESEYSEEISYTIPPANTFTITATAGAHGSILPAGSVVVKHGADQSFTITPNPNYSVANVVVDGASVGAVASYTFTNVTANHSISANFASDHQPPVADAGLDQIAVAGSLVTLDGTNSSDPDGGNVSYKWKQIAGPRVTLFSTQSPTVALIGSYVLSDAETLTFELTVTDEDGLTDVDSCAVILTKYYHNDFDGDGVPNYNDDFPLDPNEWLDTDGDGVGNNADLDDDDDGMPDAWEIGNDLDPLANDAEDDPDADGFTNLAEYKHNTDPHDPDSFPPVQVLQSQPWLIHLLLDK